MRQRDEALALLRGADLFCVASRTETQGLVVAEALAAGLPVVGLDAPGVRDAVRPGIDGLLVAGSPHEQPAIRLAEAIGALVDDGPRRHAMAAAAVEGASRFDLATRIGDMVELYRSTIARRR
jgi:glycosyltransferase involved in cell wall biosynthesis